MAPPVISNLATWGFSPRVGSIFSRKGLCQKRLPRISLILLQLMPKHGVTGCLWILLNMSLKNSLPALPVLLFLTFATTPAAAGEAKSHSAIAVAAAEEAIALYLPPESAAVRLELTRYG